MTNTVLVVDYDAATQELLRIALQAMHFEVITSASGFEATQHLQQRIVSPRLILVNLRLPAKDGLTSYELIRWIRQVPSLEMVPIISLVSGTQTEAQQAMDMGATSCIGLPFRPIDLKERVSAVLEHCR